MVDFERRINAVAHELRRRAQLGQRLFTHAIALSFRRGHRGPGALVRGLNVREDG
jgi:hypothetical protein